MIQTVTRYHDFSAGHRVVGHESKCQHLHGHNYRVHFVVEGNELDDVGRVIDFGVIKSCLCEWLEDNWDHKTLLWSDDPLWEVFDNLTPNEDSLRTSLLNIDILHHSFVNVPFNPTAENMARYLVTVVGPRFLPTHVTLLRVTVEETRKCSAEYGHLRTNR